MDKHFWGMLITYMLPKFVVSACLTKAVIDASNGGEPDHTLTCGYVIKRFIDDDSVTVEDE